MMVPNVRPKMCSKSEGGNRRSYLGFVNSLNVPMGTLRRQNHEAQRNNRKRSAGGTIQQEGAHRGAVAIYRTSTLALDFPSHQLGATRQGAAQRRVGGQDCTQKRGAAYGRQVHGESTLCGSTCGEARGPRRQGTEVAALASRWRYTKHAGPGVASWLPGTRCRRAGHRGWGWGRGSRGPGAKAVSYI